MIRRPTRSTRTDTLFPYTTLFRSHIRSGRRAALRDVHPTGLAGPITATTATPVHDPRAIGRGAAKKRRMLWIRGYGPINGRQSLGRSIAIEKRSEEHTSELQSLMRISYAVFCLNKKKIYNQETH